MDPNEYLTPFEAAAQLERLSDELLAYGVDVEDLEELRQLWRRFHRHLNGREALYDLLRDVAERILCSSSSSPISKIPKAFVIGLW